jgi:arginine repressor
MPKASTIEKLPAELRETLDNRLRNGCYGPLDEAIAWLLTQGHTISRSALSRYIGKLRVVDARNGNHSAMIQLTPQPTKWTSGKKSQVSSIIGELKRLQSLQNDLIQQLALLNGSID